jgi:hypothetical protein
MPAFNYFNYFTEIEQYFWQKRGANLLISPLDWAVLETWQKAGIPLAAVLKGIDRAFESYSRSKRGAAGRSLKSLTYCVDAVTEAAIELREARAGAGPEPGRAAAREPFSRDDLRAYFTGNAGAVRESASRFSSSNQSLANSMLQTAARLDELAVLPESPAILDLEDLERRLNILEEKLSSAANAAAPEDILLQFHREMDSAISPFRRKMTADQIALLGRQYLQKRLFEHFRIPRLSLFYLL